MNEWQKLLPSEIRPSMDMLKGEALVDRLGTSSWVKGFSRSRLPTKPADRFAALFKERPRWVLEDLQHYLRLASVAVFSLSCCKIRVLT